MSIIICILHVILVNYDTPGLAYSALAIPYMILHRHMTTSRIFL